MEEVKKFFIQNWQLIASALLCIFSVIFTIIAKRKKGYTFGDIIIGLITENLPEWIHKAEKVGGTGEQKKVQVLNAALSFASKTLGRKLSEEETSFIVTQASEQIEKILGTPESKDGAKKLEAKK